jgi:hypothetical protein
MYLNFIQLTLTLLGDKKITKEFKWNYPAFPESFKWFVTTINKYINSAIFPNNLLVIFLNLMYYIWSLGLCRGLISILISSRTLTFAS